MPFLSETEAAERLGFSQATNPNTFLSVIRPTKDTGVGVSQKTFSEQERILFGVLGHLDGSRPTSRVFGVGHDTVTAAMRGKTSMVSATDLELKERVNTAVSKFRDRIQGLASQKLEDTLVRITDDKLDDIKKASELATIASSLAKIHRDLDPQDKVPSGTAVQFNIFRPRTKNEDEYEVIQVVE